LNENATRQLVFRAKAAFKKALVGEAETRGLTVSEIISVAARKASKDAGKYVSVASALLLVLAVSIGVLPNLANSPEQLNATTPTIATELETSSGVGADADAGATDGSAANSASTSVGDSLASSAELAPTAGIDLANGPVANNPPSNNAELNNVESLTASVAFASLGSRADYTPFDPWLLDSIIEQGAISTNLLGGKVVTSSGSASLLSVISEQGLWADLQFQPAASIPFQAVIVGIYVDGKQYFARTSQQDLIVLAEDSRTETYVYVGSIDLLTDVSGARYDNTRLDGGQVQITITVDTQTGVVSSTSLQLAGRI
jgi:RNA polymerase sigma-70 factor (ECF subfamily)